MERVRKGRKKDLFCSGTPSEKGEKKERGVMGLPKGKLEASS